MPAGITDNAITGKTICRKFSNEKEFLQAVEEVIGSIWDTVQQSQDYLDGNVLDRIEPIPEVHVSPSQLRSVGVEPGDFVNVSTRRGKIKLAVRVDNALQDDVIFIPFCFFN